MSRVPILSSTLDNIYSSLHNYFDSEKGKLVKEYDFVARYKGSTRTYSGIEEIQASSRSELLEKARAISEQSGLPLVLISVRDWGQLRQVWNAERAVRPERKGDGWREDMTSDFLDNFPE